MVSRTIDAELAMSMSETSDAATSVTRTYRFGVAWRALGITFVALAAILPLLMLANNEPFELSLVLILVAFGIAGAWCYAHFAAYSVTVNDGGLLIERLARRRLVVPWREVVSWRSNEHEIIIRTVAQQKVSISVHFPGYDAILAAASRSLPDVVFSSPGERPIVSVEPALPEKRREHHLAMRRAWLRQGLRSLLLAIGVAIAAAAAGVALERIAFREMPRSLALPVIYVLAFITSWGYTMSVMLVVFALLYAVMATQESVRARRPPPAA